MMSSISAFAQLPDGSYAPNFTVTDINGNSHTLYDYLDAGTPVVLQFSAAWSGPDWYYFQSNALHQLFDNHGPDATNEVMVIFIESDNTTSLGYLDGTDPNALGDWITGTNFPIVDDGQFVFEAYENTYYPTIYTICPNRILTETGQIDYAAHLAFIQESSCGEVTNMNDPVLLNYVGPTADCLNNITAELTLFNQGLSDLTSVEITTTGCSNCPIVTNWSGQLGSLELETIQIPNVQLTQNSAVQFQITSANDDTTDDTVTTDLEIVVDAVNEIHIDVMTDCWPEESSWAILDESDATVASGSYTEGETNHSEVVTLDYGCYTFVFYDTYGDGLNGTVFGCANDGSVLVTSVNPFQTVESVIWDYDGSTQFSEHRVTFTVSENEFYGCTDIDACNIDLMAVIDDGSCVYGDDACGCTDPTSVNYNPLSVWDDGSCQPSPIEYGTVTDVLGMVYDLEAIAASGQKILFHFLADWNPFDPLITPDINSIYTEYGCNTADVFVIGINNQSGDVITQDWATTNAYLPPIVSLDGGADPLFNYFQITAWPTVLLSDEYIALDANIYVGFDGETEAYFNQIAPNYSINQSSCIADVPGCMDPTACNFSPLATLDDESCDYTCNQNCTNIGQNFWNDIAPGLYPMETTSMVYGIPHTSELVFNTTLQYYDSETDNTFDIDSIAVNSISIAPPGIDFFLPDSPVVAGTQACIPLAGIPAEEGVFAAEFDCTVYLTFFGNPAEITNVIYSHLIEVTPNFDGIPGCTYPSATNFNPLATLDDSSCEFPSGESVCGPGTIWDEQLEMCMPEEVGCLADIDGSGAVDTGDLLALLGAYGNDCE